MRPHPLDRVVAALDLRNDGVVIVAVKPPAIANLPAGFGVKRCVIKNNFAFLASLEFLRALAVVDDGENLAAVGTGLAVAFEG
jgi:hypothetical protein